MSYYSVPAPPDLLLANGNVRCDMLLGPCRCGYNHAWGERVAIANEMIRFGTPAWVELGNRIIAAVRGAL